MQPPQDDETSYDTALPDRIGKELKADAPAPEPAPVLPSRKKILASKRLVSAVLLAGVALYAAFAGRSGALPSGLPTARASMAARDFPAVLKALEACRAEGSLGQEGRLLDDTARGMLDLEAAEKAGDWVGAYESSLILARVWKEPGALRAQIERGLDRARSEVLAGQKLAEGRELLASGSLEEALKLLAQVPAGTACAGSARAESGRARAKLSQAARAQAQAAADKGLWEEAATSVALADPEDPDVQALSKRIAAGREQTRALADAEALLSALRVEEAAARLETVDKEGPCAAPRAALASRLEGARKLARRVEEARTLFDQGDAERALALPGIPEGLRRGISDTQARHQAVLEALDRRDDLAALDGVRALLALPLAEGNGYRSRAQEALPSLERKARDLAEKAVGEGVAAFRDRRWRQAREAFEKARRAAPAHPVAEVYLQRLAETGRDLYRDGYVLKSLDPEAARERFDQALACLPPGDPTVQKIREALP